MNVDPIMQIERGFFVERVVARQGRFAAIRSILAIAYIGSTRPSLSGFLYE